MVRFRSAIAGLAVLMLSAFHSVPFHRNYACLVLNSISKKNPTPPLAKALMKVYLFMFKQLVADADVWSCFAALPSGTWGWGAPASPWSGPGPPPLRLFGFVFAFRRAVIVSLPPGNGRRGGGDSSPCLEVLLPDVEMDPLVFVVIVEGLSECSHRFRDWDLHS